MNNKTIFTRSMKRKLEEEKEKKKNIPFEIILDRIFEEKTPLYPVAIDFDEASKEWNRNKKRLANGCYTYKK